jgi:hypothetical protein
MLYLNEQFNVEWPELSPGQHQRLRELKWTEKRWQHRDTPEVYTNDWSSLVPAEQRAATFLGYTPEVWEGCVEETSCIERLELMDHKMSEFVWDQMPSAIQEHLVILGWEEQTWTEGQSTEERRKKWTELTNEEKTSAQLLGFSEDVWGYCPQAPCLPRLDYIMRKYGGPDHSGVAWNSMKLAVQQAWMLLGYTESLWAAGKEATSHQLTWMELSLEQQAQAEFLGYSLATWAGCFQEWGPAPVNENLTKMEPPDPHRIVRGRMTIQLPFAEISGNVYGKEVAQVPVAFITIFKRAVGRALFCGNPPVGDAATFQTSDGKPLCQVNQSYEMQMNRVQVLTVVEGSIIVDFLLTKNVTHEQSTSAELFDALKELLDNQQSPLCQDMEFGRFARAASIVEVHRNASQRAEDEAAQLLEKMRSSYDAVTACNLEKDFRNGDIICPTDGASRYSIGYMLMWIVTAVVLGVSSSLS